MAVGKPGGAVDLIERALGFAAGIDDERPVLRYAACRDLPGGFLRVASEDRTHQLRVVFRSGFGIHQKDIRLVRIEAVQKGLFMVFTLFVGQIGLLGDRVAVHGHGGILVFCGKNLRRRHGAEVLQGGGTEVLKDLSSGFERLLIGAEGMVRPVSQHGAALRDRPAEKSFGER